MAISSNELIEALTKEIGYRSEVGPQPATRDTDFIRDATAAIKRLQDNPSDRAARKEAREITNRIQSKPLRGRRLD